MAKVFKCPILEISFKLHLSMSIIYIQVENNQVFRLIRSAKEKYALIEDTTKITVKFDYSHVPNLGRFLGDTKFQNRPKFGKFSW